MKFKPIPKKHTWFHKINPFNKMLRNHLNATLRAPASTVATYTSPVLDQGDTEECAIYANAATLATIKGKPFSIQTILTAVLSYMNIPASSYEGTDLQTAMFAMVNPGASATDGTTYAYTAILWIYPQSGESFCEAINDDIQQYQRPANLAGTWFNEFDGSVNGVITTGAKNILGGHDMLLAGINSNGFMVNQGSWGVDAPGSVNGFYFFSPQVFDSYYTGYKCGIGIDSTNPTVVLLGKLSSFYVKLIDIIT